MLRQKIYEVTDGLKSDRTKEEYRRSFTAFLKQREVDDEDLVLLLQKDPRELEEIIADYLVYLDKVKHLKHSSINLAKSAIIHFFVINRVVLNKDWISKFIKPDEDHKEDRAYTDKEIQKLLSVSDERYRVVFLLLASTGLRIGAIPELKIGHLSKVKFPSLPTEDIYVIWVYQTSGEWRYYCFTTPELTKAVDEYLAYRQQFGEIIKPEAPLIREQFNIEDPVAARVKIRSLSRKTYQKAILRLMRKCGLSNSIGKREVAITNGFRKRCMTKMIEARVDYDTREYLIGHKQSRGLNVSYDRTDQASRFAEWSKSIDLLEVNPTDRLERQVDEYESQRQEMRRYFREQEERTIKMYKEIDARMKAVEEARKADTRTKEEKKKDREKWLRSVLKEPELSKQLKKDTEEYVAIIPDIEDIR